MRQVWIPRIGPPEVLTVREAPDPQPGPGQVRVAVRASGVNFADVMARLGLYPDAPKLPAVVGYEVAGTVDAMGPGVTAPGLGARVVAMVRFGGYSDRVVTPAGQCLPFPESLSFEKAAAIPVNTLTAWVMLVHRGAVGAGEWVLIHAGAGGVGLSALQICKWRGARVIATASPSKHQRLLAMGAEHCIDYTRLDFEEEVKRITGGRGVDLVLDSVAGRSFAKSYRCLAPLGRMFMFGVSSLAPGKKRNLFAAVRGLLSMPTFKPVPLMNDNRGVFGINMGHLWQEAELLQGMLQKILSLVGDGTFDPVVDRTFPFSEAAQAHHYLQGRKNFGKVVLIP
jgi:NADPH:quinone reductase-like Zn-dependent oxidoreductase